MFLTFGYVKHQDTMRICYYTHFSVKGPHVAPEGDLAAVFEGDQNVDPEHQVLKISTFSALIENIELHLSDAHFTFEIGTRITILQPFKVEKPCF